MKNNKIEKGNSRIDVLLKEAIKLPTDERLELVHQIWDSIEPDEIEVSEAQKRELDRRIAYDNENMMTWKELKKDLLKDKRQK